jgi:hypothetical protein
MDEDKLRRWVIENLRIDVSVFSLGDGCPEECISSTRKVRVRLLLTDGTEVDNEESIIE